MASMSETLSKNYMVSAFNKAVELANKTNYFYYHPSTPAGEDYNFTTTINGVEYIRFVQTNGVVFLSDAKGVVAGVYAQGQDNSIQGTLYGENVLMGGINSDDWLTGGERTDVLFGMGGSDKLTGNLGDDYLIAGMGPTFNLNNYVDSQGHPKANFLSLMYDSLSQSTDNYTYWGTAGSNSQNSTLYGGTQRFEPAELVNGYTDNDTLISGNGNDKLYGEAGNDVLIAGAGNDLLIGDFERFFNTDTGYDGNDFLMGGEGNDTLWGRGGDDTLIGGAGADIMHGETGFDIVSYMDSTAGIGLDMLHKSEGSTEPDLGYGDGYGDFISDIERIEATNYDDTIYLGETWTVIWDNSRPDTKPEPVQDYIAKGLQVVVGAGNDQVYGYTGNDTVWGGDGNDYIEGGAGNDQLYGDAGNDVIKGDAGNDSIWGGIGSDSIDGGIGADQILGEAGDDLLLGGDGNDTISGGDGNDQISGDAGNDIIYGDAGNDFMNGGLGNDTLYGGAGSDTYLFMLGDGQDWAVEAATAGENDFVALHNSITNWGLVQSGNNLIVCSVVNDNIQDMLVLNNWFVDQSIEYIMSYGSDTAYSLAQLWASMQPASEVSAANAQALADAANGLDVHLVDVDSLPELGITGVDVADVMSGA